MRLRYLRQIHVRDSLDWVVSDNLTCHSKIDPNNQVRFSVGHFENLCETVYGEISEYFQESSNFGDY
jgi:hypothetical protein